jgi:uncharacterized protein (TIGR03083 family)
MESQMENKTTLIQALDEARQKMRAELPDLDPQMPIYPGWTIKQLLAHLTGWDEATTAALHAHTVGNEPGTPAVRGINHYNAQSVVTREALSYDHIVKEWELARDQLKAALLAVPDEKIAEPLVFPWGPTGVIRNLVAIFVDHEIEHAKELQDLKAQYRPPAAAN